VLEGVDWFELVEVGWVADEEPLDGWAGCAELVLLDAPVPVEVADEAPDGVWVPPDGPVGLAPPGLITVEVPPLALGLGGPSTVVVEVDSVASVVAELDAGTGSGATRAARGRGGPVTTGGDAAGGM
jgi:hypothetical protein